MAGTNLPERELAAELAVAVSQFMLSELPDNIDEHGFVWHDFQGPFDENCHVLWELGVALAASPFGSQGFSHQEWANATSIDVVAGAFKFMPPEKTRSIMIARGEIAETLLFRLLETYLRSMGDYSWRQAQLDVSRDLFLPEPIFEPQIGALVECGYLERSGQAVKWTERIGPIMYSAGHWDETSDHSPSSAIVLPPSARARVESLIRAGQRIEAVAVIRDAARVGLAEAKSLMEVVERSSR